MNRSLANILIDLVSALLFLGMVATGYILRFPLPPGSNKDFVLWGWSRHQWGDLHFWLSVGLLLAMLIHLALHWNWIVSVVAKRCGRQKNVQPSLARSAVWTISVFCMLSLAFAWLADSSVQSIERAHGPGYFRQHPNQAGTAAIADSADPTKALAWEDIQPIFQAHCQACHGPQTQAAGIRMDRRQDLFKPEAPLIVPGQSGNSRLVGLISGNWPEQGLASSHRLNKADVDLIKRWIDQGAQ